VNNVTFQVVRDIIHRTDKSGGESPRMLYVSEDVFKELVVDFRDRAKESDVRPIDAHGFLISDYEEPTSLMVIGTPVFPVKRHHADAIAVEIAERSAMWGLDA
jgi:hypothetical protein